MNEPAQPPIDEARLWARVEALAAFTQPDVPWTRRAFTDLCLSSREWLRAEMENAGLSVALDAAGNLVGRREGRTPGLAPLVTGSHCDTVVGGGRFDGIIGVLAGIEAAHALQDQGVALEHPFEVIDFLSEEPSDYGMSCVGSRGLVGRLDAQALRQSNPAGETLAEALRRMGGRPEELRAALRAPGSVAAFVELHIEQGPVLEAEGLPIGIVTNIVGIRRVALKVTGQPDHAGTTPMTIRRDALVGAATLIERVHAQASEIGGRPDYVVATIGRIAVTPNVPNAVPGQVEMVLEVRSDNPRVLDTFPEQVLASVRERLTALRLEAAMSHLTRPEPTDCTPLVMDAAEAAARDLGYPQRRLPSGAGHDAALMAACGPIGMVFVPCLKGRSHCPEEWIEPHQLHDGARVLLRTLLRLDRQLAN